MRELKDYIEVRRYLDTSIENLVKVNLNNNEINYLIINPLGDVVDSGEIIESFETFEIKKENKKTGKIYTIKEVIEKESNTKESQTFFNSQVDVRTLNIGQEPSIRHKENGKYTTWVNTYKITSMEIYA